MATLKLDRVWVTRMDTWESVSAQTERGRQRQVVMQGEVRQFAGGRQRSFAQVGKGGTWTFTMRMVSLAQISTLESWMSLLVLVRDHRGQAFTGTFFAVTPTEYQDPGLWDVAIVLNIVTVEGF